MGFLVDFYISGVSLSFGCLDGGCSEGWGSNGEGSVPQCAVTGPANEVWYLMI